MYRFLGVVSQVMTQPREENEETVHEDWMSYAINMQRRHGSFSLPFQRSEFLLLKNSSPIGGSNRRYLHKDPRLKHLPFTRPLFPSGNLLLLLLMKMLQRIKHWLPLLTAELCSNKRNEMLLKPTAGENPVTTVTASSVA